MKTKKKQKKLALNKITIVQLDNVDMNQAKGGTRSTIMQSCGGGADSCSCDCPKVALPPD
jgi:natural product precursor